MKRSKQAIRKTFLAIRKTLSQKRREEGEKAALHFLSKRVAQLRFVLSFASHKEEINLWPFNRALAREGRLLLPKVFSEKTLIPYHIQDLEKELIPHPQWGILEPKVDLCRTASLEEIGVVLVPGVVFDHTFQRLGYGKGIYDRFLLSLGCPLIGVGFKEQVLKSPLPCQAHDVPLNELALF